MSDVFMITVPTEAEMQRRIKEAELDNYLWRTRLETFIKEVAGKVLSPEDIVKAWDQATEDFDGFLELCEVLENTLEALFQDDEIVVVILDTFYLPIGAVKERKSMN